MRPAPVSRIVNHPDWVGRGKTARDLLVAAYGYRARDFVVVDAALRDSIGISLGWRPEYPRDWQDQFMGQRWNWVAERAIPLGLHLYWPEGVDFTGEGYDAADPIFLLNEVLFWELMSDDEFRQLCGED